jgi:hypothetical protein
VHNDTSGPAGFTGLRWYTRKEETVMKNISQATTAIRLTTISAAVVAATAVMGGGYALASSNNHGTNAPRVGTFTATLRYLVGNNVSVPADSAGQNATKCPSGMFPVGGGPSSPSTMWMLQFSNADNAIPGKLPNEWHVGLFNNTGSAQVFKVFVVCSTAQKVSSNY